MNKKVTGLNSKFSLKKTVCILLTGILCLGTAWAQNKDQNKQQTKQAVNSVPEKKNEPVTTINILHAQKTTNLKDDKTKEESIEFTGEVEISIERDGTKTVISADKMIFNRSSQMLYAQGNVNFEQTESDGSKQNISATSVLFNASTLEGVFDDGRVVQAQSNSLNLPSGSTLIVASDVFARNHSGTVAFKTGNLTFCNDENPHWRILASRIWLLPGNEFAFLNALLFVDNIPMLYLPAFYYPKDELIFNPVFGFRNRAGYYFQTTTYIVGRKPLQSKKSNSDSASALLDDTLSLIKPTKLMEQELQGIVLHNLDKPFTGDTSNYLKFIADWYTNIGVGVGLDGSYKPPKIFSNIEGNLIFGFSHTVFPTNSANVFVPFDSSGKRYQDSSEFLGMKLPFRYKAGLKLAMNNPFNLSLNMPVYSDPFFDYDFGERDESMDWFSYLLNNPGTQNSTTTEQQKLDAAQVNSFTWELNGSYNVPLSDKLKPYINNLSVSSLTSSIVFNSKNGFNSYDSRSWEYNTPERKFFFPSQITPIKIGTTFSGTIVSIGSNTSKKSTVPSFPVEMIPPDELKKPEKTTEETSADTSSTRTGQQQIMDDAFKALSVTAPSVSPVTGLTFDLGYTVTPSFESLITYSPLAVPDAHSFNWNKMQSFYINVKSPVKLNDSLSLRNGFFTMSNSVSFDPVWQSHPYIAEGDGTDGSYTPDAKSLLQKADYTSSSLTLANTNTISLKPFVFTKHFKQTGINYNTNIKFMRTEFVGDAENPKWDALTVDWTDPNSITSHSLDLVLAANESNDNFRQALTLTTTLPPQGERYYADLKLDFPYVSFDAQSGITKPAGNNSEYQWEPFKQGLSVHLFDNSLTFSESFNYDVKNNTPDSLKLALTYKDFQLSYLMRYTNSYDFDSTIGWVQNANKSFLPYSLNFAYSTANNEFYFWKNRICIGLGLSTSLDIDFVRPTNSSFVFSPSLKFKINDFFDITFSSTSKNEVLYRYVQKALGHEGRIPGEENIFIDLINSFRFDDENLRKSSGFKLKSLNMTISHNLHDWDLKSTFKIEPRLVNENGRAPYYDFNPYFTLSVVWRPMESFKTEIIDEYGVWKLDK
ncbi:MAG: hypothetical protein MJ169_04715 [Treponema sp.]|nr:hypothetical protein [Treponema sp.]